MRSHLESWIIECGDVPELSVGSSLLKTGLRVDDARFELVVEGPQSDATEVGVVGHIAWARMADGWHEALLRCTFYSLLTRSRTEPAEVTIASHVDVSGEMSVIADYEYDAFDLPDVRQDWRVCRLAVEYREQLWDEDGKGHQGAILDVLPIDRMSRWGDRRDGTLHCYVVDLEPTT